MRDEKQKNFVEEVPPTEDLMREHGILNRLLLVYEAVIRAEEEQHFFYAQPLMRAIDLVQSFIHGYHEKLEETQIFPLFEKAKKQISLVKTLRKQHVRGREITDKIHVVLSKKALGTQDKKLVLRLLKRFIALYRPHEAREDTVLFPLVRTLTTEQEFAKLGELFEETEHALFGKEGFEGILRQVVGIEKELGIYKLEQFTPTGLN